MVRNSAMKVFPGARPFVSQISDMVGISMAFPHISGQEELSLVLCAPNKSVECQAISKDTPLCFATLISARLPWTYVHWLCLCRNVVVSVC